ncbi:TPA: DNA mismatch endonuclease Vsr [Legionella pneumophila]|nr:DNA mismatch endonuclease Vsr [Legionella pneumophila]
MSSIKGKNTKPELIVRSFLHRQGLRYRLHSKLLPGMPDLVFRKYNAVIFVHGCFWHAHDDPLCKSSHLPKSNTLYWQTKIEKNKKRDERNIQMLKELGWRIFIIWECQTKNEKYLNELLDNLSKVKIYK